MIESASAVLGSLASPLSPEADPARILLARMAPARRPELAWTHNARPEQRQPEGRWRVWYVRGGRGGGKTATGSGTLAQWIVDDWDDPGEWGVVAPTYADCWATCIEGESGLLAQFGTSLAEVRAGDSEWVEHWHRSWGEMAFRNGAIVRAASADDGGLRIQGKNLRGAWADEVGLWDSWETAWDESLAYAVRKGIARIIATGTPKISRKARDLIRRFLNDETVPVSTLRTLDNAANLSPQFIEEVVARNQGTRLERQELEGELLDDVEGALWTRALIESCLVQEHKPKFWRKVVIALDPSDGTERGDEQGICVVGQSAEDSHLYVLHSDGMRVTPWEYLNAACDIADGYYPNPVTIVLEKNHGGTYLTSLLEQVFRTRDRIPYQTVHASQGKRTRAEPVVGIYERGRIHHVGHHPELEDQLATFTGTAGEKSPDRLDALVWACWPFIGNALDTSEVAGRQGGVYTFANGASEGVYRYSPERQAIADTYGDEIPTGRALPVVRW